MGFHLTKYYKNSEKKTLDINMYIFFVGKQVLSNWLCSKWVFGTKRTTFQRPKRYPTLNYICTKKFVKLISRKIRNKITVVFILNVPFVCTWCFLQQWLQKKSRSGQCPSKYFLREFETCFPCCLLKTIFQYLCI